MPYYRRKSRYHQVWGQLKPWLLGALGLAALGGLWLGLTQIGPRDVAKDDATTRIAEEDESTQTLRREVAQLRGALSGVEGSAEVVLLQEAVAKQRELVERGRAGQADIRRLGELQIQLDTARATVTNLQIAMLVERADAADQAGETVAVVAAWQEALRLQRTVNRSGAAAAEKNFVREERFEKQLQELETQPLADEVAAAMAAARLALHERRWSDALAALSTARGIQLRINNEFARSRFASLGTINEIEREIETLDAAVFAIEVDEYEAAGDAAMLAGSYEAAVTAFEEARQTQLRLNREFSRSRFLSSPRVEQLEVKRQTASSVPRLEGIQTEMAAIDRLLFRREVGLAVEKITTAANRLEGVFTHLPKSKVLDASLRLKLSYLDAQAERLREIQDAVYERLRPLPGVAERRLLETEFPQSLYLQIMRFNPSRNAGRAFPVDSVNWHEAMACCERLSWIMARPVRLPTVDEFRVAVGDPSTHVITSPDAAVSQRMAGSPASESGFYELLGNLAEWLSPSADDDEGLATVGGGSFRDDEAALRAVPVQTLERAARSRHVGFRILVEFETD